MNTKTRFFLASLLIVLPFDQITKQWIIANIHYGDRIPVVPGLFNLTHVRNPGGAFSFFADGSVEARMVFFIGTTMIAIAMLLYFFRQLDPEERLPAVALGIVLGGAVGNLTDRILYGEVIDFLDVHLWGGYVWPTFNVGDSAIVIGVGLLIIEIFLAGDEENGVPEPSNTSGESPG